MRISVTELSELDIKMFKKCAELEDRPLASWARRALRVAAGLDPNPKTGPQSQTVDHIPSRYPADSAAQGPWEDIEDDDREFADPEADTSPIGAKPGYLKKAGV